MSIDYSTAYVKTVEINPHICNHSMDLKELESGVNPKTHWYYQSKKQPMLRFINAVRKQNNVFNLVDIGAGSGFFSEEVNLYVPQCILQTYLVDTAYTLAEIDISQSSLMRKQHALPTEIKQSIVLMMDVLEHVADDALMLRNIKQHAIGKNYFFITVPAFQSIWSAHDVYLEHYRRYTKTSLKQVLTNSGFQVNRMYYLYGSLFPLVFIKRKLSALFTSKNEAPVSDMKPLPNWLNQLLLRYSTLEMWCTKYNTFFGLTCVAEGSF